jgi:polyisoprenoid-binding protein YceI
MGAGRLRSAATAVVATLGVTLLLSASVAPPKPQTPEISGSEILLTVNPNQSSVHWTVDTTFHQVHGTFSLKSGDVHFNPQTGRASGEIIVDATTGKSGNNSRDSRMHKEILETPKYPDAVFRPTQLDGRIALSGPSDANLHGVFSLHGTNHDLVAPIHAELTGDRWKGTTHFEVPYVTWGIKDPSNFLLKVKHTVNVELQLSGEVQPPAK